MLPQWSTPERQSTMVKIFQRTNGLCVYGHLQCPVEAHCYEEYLEGLIAEWKSADASRRAVEWEIQWRRMHDIDTREVKRRIPAGRVGKRHYTLLAFVERDRPEPKPLPTYEIVSFGVNAFTMQKTALVRIPGLALPVHLFVDVGKAMEPSRNARRKAERYGVTLPTVGEMCKAAVMDWRQQHNLD